MKKFILSLLVAFCGMSANAQIVSSTSRSVSYTKHEKTTTWYGKVGLNVNGLVGKGASDMDAKARAGYDLNFGFQKPMGRAGLYWGMEFGLTSRGFKQSVSGGNASVTEKELRHDVIFSPFTFGFRKNLVGDLDIDAHVGYFLSCDYTGKDKITAKVGSQKATESTSMSDWDNYNRFDTGLKFGVGLWYKRYNLDLSYRQGFVNMWGDGDSETNLSGNFIVSLGIAF